MPASVAGKSYAWSPRYSRGVRYARCGFQRRLKKPHREIAQVELLVGAGAVDFAQRVVDGELELAVLGLHHDSEAGAKIAVVEKGAALEAAATLRLRAV